MNVSISIIEAERLSFISGRNLAAVSRPVRHRSDEFSGIPCPFLQDNACTVYEHRPFACRAHYSFDDTAYWCHPERSNAAEFSLLESGGAKAMLNKSPSWPVTCMYKCTAHGGLK